jgi:Cu/Ag efflux protein CusF
MRYVALSLAAALALITTFVLPVHGQQTQRRSQSDAIAAFTAEVTGTVQKVDPQTGVLTLQTVDGPVNVRFPAPAVQPIKPGDLVTVAFGLVKQPPSASPSTTPGSGSGSGSSGYGGSGSGSGTR